MGDSALIAVLIGCAIVMSLGVGALLYVCWLEVVDPLLTLRDDQPSSGR